MRLPTDGDQTKGHSRVFAILNCDVQVRPVTLMVSRSRSTRYKVYRHLMGSTVLGGDRQRRYIDTVRYSDIPKEEPTILASSSPVWLDPESDQVEVDHNILFEQIAGDRRRSAKKTIHQRTGIDWLLAN